MVARFWNLQLKSRWDWFWECQLIVMHVIGNSDLFLMVLMKLVEWWRGLIIVWCLQIVDNFCQWCSVVIEWCWHFHLHLKLSVPPCFDPDLMLILISRSHLNLNLKCFGCLPLPEFFAHMVMLRSGIDLNCNWYFILNLICQIEKNLWF
jgi:hypothetical protein